MLPNKHLSVQKGSPKTLCMLRTTLDLYQTTQRVYKIQLAPCSSHRFDENFSS
jgi:hypothetical protein